MEYMVQPLHFHFYSAGPVFNNICIVSVVVGGRWPGRYLAHLYKAEISSGK